MSRPVPESSPVARRKVHIVLNGKGGIGKSFAAGLIAQFLRDRGEPLVCLDTDPINATFSATKALGVEPVGIVDEAGDVNIHAVDGMVERFLTEDSNFVIDSGASVFLPLSQYLVNGNVADAVGEAGKQMVVHAIVAGGQELLQCARGFDSMAKQYPPEVGMVLWLNEFHGPSGGADGKRFEDTLVFKAHEHRLSGVVRLVPLHPTTFGASLADMLRRGMTFAEADQSTELFVMAKQRLRQIQRPLWEQLGAVL